MRKKIKIACGDCSLQQLCLPVGLDDSEFVKLEKIVQRGKPLARGKHIYFPGDPFTSLYAVRSGTVKTYSVAADGTEYVTGFYLPGEIIGLDALCTGVHPCGAKTLETSSLCELPFDLLDEVSETVPNISRQLMRVMSSELQTDEQLLMMVGSQPAKARLVALFLSLSTRLNRRGYSATEFSLSMSRADIGSYLGLAVETVSRLLKKLQDQDLIEVNHRQIKLKDLDKLREMVNLEIN